jgi:hypothetical protein
MNKIDKVKKVLLTFCVPKINGMSATEISRMIVAIKDDEDEDFDEDFDEDYEEDGDVAKNYALREANKSLN